MTELVKEVKDLRLAISELIVMVNLLPKTRETSLTYTKLEEGFMFLGKVLEYLGNESPYPTEINKATDKIADSVDPNKIKLPEGTDLEVVKQVRDLIQQVISANTWNKLFDITTPPSCVVIHTSVGWMFVNYALINIVAAKMWLGMEVNNIVSVKSPKVEDHKEEVKFPHDKHLEPKEMKVEKPKVTPAKPTQPASAKPKKK